ncbi:hypothetical protein ACLKA7_010041 [Drosophila subpalustris]
MNAACASASTRLEAPLTTFLPPIRWPMRHYLLLIGMGYCSMFQSNGHRAAAGKLANEAHSTLTKYGKDVAKAAMLANYAVGWPIASEEYLISCSPVDSLSQSQSLSPSNDALAHKVSYLIFMATQMRKVWPNSTPPPLPLRLQLLLLLPNLFRRWAHGGH